MPYCYCLLLDITIIDEKCSMYSDVQHFLCRARREILRFFIHTYSLNVPNLAMVLDWHSYQSTLTTSSSYFSSDSEEPELAIRKDKNEITHHKSRLVRKPLYFESSLTVINSPTQKSSNKVYNPLRSPAHSPAHSVPLPLGTISFRYLEDDICVFVVFGLGLD